MNKDRKTGRRLTVGLPALDTRGFRDDEPLFFDLAVGVIRAAEFEAYLHGTALVETNPATGETRHIPRDQWMTHNDDDLASVTRAEPDPDQ